MSLEWALIQLVPVARIYVEHLAGVMTSKAACRFADFGPRVAFFKRDDGLTVLYNVS